ncbi:MAG: hypothetical protein OSB09_01410 [Planctomycetota bacterium]|nr:hypothetical protein [Planctomycetota bacterium]
MSLPNRVDLHLHTRCSDGALTASEVVERSSGVLSCISICDHDTLAAYHDLQVPQGLRVLPGFEMTCQAGPHDLHLLAYFPAGLTTPLLDWVQQLEDDRRDRVMNGVLKLRDSGIPLRIADLEAELQGGVPCRSHVARALVRGGLAATTRPLYKRWLGGDRFARPALVGADAIEQVHRFAGLVFWAHPAAVHLKQVGRSLVEAGLDGVECLSKNLGPRDRAAARQFMEQHQLGVCGGSDLHFETVRARVGSYGVEESLIDPRLMGAGLRSTSQ